MVFCEKKGKTRFVTICYLNSLTYNQPIFAQKCVCSAD
jgi:hypothetical protein